MLKYFVSGEKPEAIDDDIEEMDSICRRDGFHSKSGKDQCEDDPPQSQYLSSFRKAFEHSDYDF